MATWLDYGIAADQNFRANQEQQLRQQQAQQQMMLFQQAQQDRQRQQAAQAAAGNALPQLLQSGQVAAQPQQGQMPPPPQAPQPGQASQPMQPQGGIPLPPGQPGQQPPLPQGGVQGQMPPPGIPPFRAMPTTPPQSAAPQGVIPAPPAQAAQTAPPNDQMEGGFSLSNIIQSGQKQGLSGSDLYDYVQTMEPYMTAQQKAQSEKFKTSLELKKLDAEIALHTQAAQNQQLSYQERERHDRALEKLGEQRVGIAQGNLNVRIETAGVGGTAPAPSGPGKTGADGLPAPVGGGGLSADAVRLVSTRLKAGDPTALTGLSRPARAAALNDLAKLDATGGSDIAGNQIDFAAARKGAQTATQREANIATSEKAIINPGGLADQVLDAARKTYRTGSPALNQKINYVLANYGGDPAVVDLKNALGDLEGQFNKAMAGGGVSSDAQRAETIARINDAQTLPQLEAAINRMKLGLQKEGEAAQETSKMFADRVRQAGKVGKQAPTGGGPVRINSDADYNALPSGAEFIAPDGTHRKKP